MDLTYRQGFLAMGEFLRQFYDRTNGDFPTLVADITIDRNGRPGDPAAWSDWMDACRKVVTGEIE
jgi:hypothetical protein